MGLAHSPANHDGIIFTMSSKEVAHALEGGCFMVPAWSEQLVHAQPQSWFVRDADGKRRPQGRGRV